MEETMIQAISKNISQLIIEHSKSTIEAELLLEVEVSIHETIVHMYKEIYVALIVLDSFLANVLEHYPLIVDETVFDTFMKNSDAIEDMFISINEDEECFGNEAETLGINIALQFMNEEHGFTELSLPEHMYYITQFFFLIRTYCEGNKTFSYSEKELNTALDIYNDITKRPIVIANHPVNSTTKELFVHSMNIHVYSSNQPYFDACKAALLIALNKETIIERFNIDNTDISIGSDAASAVIDNKHQLHSIIEFYSNEPVLLNSTAIQIISLLRSKYENFITDTHDLKLSDLCTLLEIMLAIVDYVSTVDSILIDNLRNSLSHTNEYDILCQHISALQNK
jgi:hypothetical protein